MSYHDIEICIRDLDSNEVVKTLLEECITVDYGKKLEMWADDKLVYKAEAILPRMSPPITRMWVNIRDYKEFLEYKKQKEAEQ